MPLLLEKIRKANLVAYTFGNQQLVRNGPASPTSVSVDVVAGRIVKVKTG